MRVLSLAALFVLLAGCAGYVADHLRPAPQIVAPELARYGLSPEAMKCVGERLSAALTVQQLGRLSRTAALVQEGYYEPGRLTLRDLMYVAGQLDDSKVSEALTEAAEACGAAAAPPVAAATRAAAPDDMPTATAPSVAPSAPAGPVWLNLGAAPSGQSIAVDASTLQRQARARTAWFRLTNPGAAAPTGLNYLLRIDCESRMLSPLADRRQDEAGAISEHRDYPPEERGPLPIEGGTVMEIAYLALCT
jgi:hypothetical protein